MTYRLSNSLSLPFVFVLSLSAVRLASAESLNLRQLLQGPVVETACSMDAETGASPSVKASNPCDNLQETICSGKTSLKKPPSYFEQKNKAVVWDVEEEWISRTKKFEAWKKKVDQKKSPLLAYHPRATRKQMAEFIRKNGRKKFVAELKRAYLDPKLVTEERQDQIRLSVIEYLEFKFNTAKPGQEFSFDLEGGTTSDLLTLALSRADTDEDVVDTTMSFVNEYPKTFDEELLKTHRDTKFLKELIQRSQPLELTQRLDRLYAEIRKVESSRKAFHKLDPSTRKELTQLPWHPILKDTEERVLKTHALLDDKEMEEEGFEYFYQGFVDGVLTKDSAGFDPATLSTENSIQIYPLAALASDGRLTFYIGHEKGHAYSLALEKTAPGTNIRAKKMVSEVKECLKARAGALPHQLEEAFSDWYGAEILSEYLVSSKLDIEARKQAVADTMLSCDDTRRAVAALGDEETEYREGDVHPYAEDRFNRIVTAHPAIRAIYGCESLPQTYCTPIEDQ